MLYFRSLRYEEASVVSSTRRNAAAKFLYPAYGTEGGKLEIQCELSLGGVHRQLWVSNFFSYKQQNIFVNMTKRRDDLLSRSSFELCPSHSLKSPESRRFYIVKHNWINDNLNCHNFVKDRIMINFVSFWNVESLLWQIWACFFQRWVFFSFFKL